MDARSLEEKIKKISTLKLQTIKSQLLDEKHKLEESIHHARAQKSTSKYFSTLALRKNFLKKLQEKFKFQDSFVDFEKSRYQEINQILKKLEEMEEAHLCAIKKTLVDLKKLSQEQQNETFESYKQRKMNLIQFLQDAAKAYRNYYVGKNMKDWTKRFDQFLDIFGAIVYVNKSISPYELDCEHGFNLQFGRSNRENKNQPVLPLKIDMMHLPFSKLIDVVNKMIEECNYYKDDKALQYIELALNAFLKKDSPYFIIEKSGLVFLDLKRIKLIKSDEEIIKNLEEETKKNLILKENELTEELRKENDEIYREASSLKEPMVASILNIVKTIENEQKQCVADLEKVSEKLFYEMTAELVKFKDLYSQAKNDFDQALGFKQKLNEIFESVLEEPLKRDQETVLKLQEESKIYLSNSKNIIEKVAGIFQEIEICKKNLESKMKIAKDILNNKLFSELELRNFHEFKKYESLKDLELEINQGYSAKCCLPDILPKCAEISDINVALQEEKNVIHAALGVIEVNLNRAKKIFEERSSRIDYHQMKERVSALYTEANKNLEIIIGKAASMTSLKESIDKSLISLKQEVSSKLYEEIQEIENTANSQYTLALSAKKTAETLCHTLHNYTLEITAAEKRAEEIEKVNQAEEVLKTFVLESILNNLDVWRVRGIGGGVNIKHNDIPYCVPHGIEKLISEKNKPNWVQNTLKTIQDRKRKKWSSFFRDEDTTGALYAILQKHLRAKNYSLQTLQSELEKIPGFKIPAAKHNFLKPL